MFHLIVYLDEVFNKHRDHSIEGFEQFSFFVTGLTLVLFNRPCDGFRRHLDE